MSDRDTVLVVTSPRDATADAVVLELACRDERVVRFDTADFPADAVLDASLSPRGWAGSLRSGGRVVELARVKSVWWRRPGEFVLPASWPDQARRFAAAEARAGLLGVLGSMPAHWVNHPAANLAANYKPCQLAVAARAGLDPPETAVTSDPPGARTFAWEQRAAGREVIFKAMGGGLGGHDSRSPRAVPTTVVDPGDLDQAVASTAVLLQERVEKAYEVRLTVVGQRMFAVAITAHSAAARLDFREDYAALTYETIRVPGHVRDGVLALMRHFGLCFGALDFAVTPDGRWRFFEVNANGQWYWLEQRVGVPIAAALADTLAAGGAG